MTFNLYVSLFFSIITILAIGYTIYIKIKSRSYTRERYAFSALAATVSLVTLGIHAITTSPPWSVWTKLFADLSGTQTPSAPPHWSEQALVVVLILFALIVINRTFQSWNGLVSVAQKEREQIHETQVWVVDGWYETLRIVCRKKPLAIYEPIDYSRSFPILEPPKETLAWHENAKELVTLRWRTHNFDPQSGWHPQASAWIGFNTKTSTPAAILCLRELPTTDEVSQYYDYVKTLFDANLYRADLFIAVQNGSGSHETTIGRNEIIIVTQSALLDDLVDFTDYFIEIERRVTVDCLPDSDLTISDVYVRPLASLATDHSKGNSFDLQDHLKVWADELSARQLALLGEYGQGKSTVALTFAYYLVQNTRRNGGRIPVLIELRGKSPSTLQPLELLGAWAATYGIEPKALLKLIIGGRALIIFEGFDEMAEVSDIESRFNHFRSLWKFAYPKNKLLITGRPNFFLDDQELKTALGLGQRSGAGPYCEALHLNFFDEPQVINALRNMNDTSKREIINLASTDRKFQDIVARPSLLYIVSLLWETALAKEKNIDSAYVIDLFIRHSYQRQAAKIDDDRQFMALSLPEREYFLDGIAAYMVAKSLSNQILPEQFRDAISRLYTTAPDQLYRKQIASEQGPMRPLSERMKERLNPIEDIETDVRAYGILVRDYSRPGALRFAHKSFFELLFARYVARHLIGEDKEECGSISVATNVTLVRVVDMPESLAFVGELLSRRTNLSAAKDKMLRDLFSLIVIGSKSVIPNSAARLILLADLLGRTFPMRIFSMMMLMIPGVIVPFLLTTKLLPHLGEHELSFSETSELICYTVFPFLAIVPFYLAAIWRTRIRFWYLVANSLGFRGRDFAKAYGKIIAWQALKKRVITNQNE
jgi:hypothetical protein